MAKVATNFASDDKEVIAAIDKMNKKLGELQEKNRKLAEDSQAASKKSSDGFDNMIAGAARAALGYLSISTAIQVVNNELQNKITLERKAADAQKYAADSERDFLRNLGLVRGVDRQQALRDVQSLSARTGVKTTDLHGALGAGLSASGGDWQKTLMATMEAARIAPDSPEIMQQLAAGIIAIGRATKSGDVKESLGLMVAAGQMSAVKDWRQISINAPQGILGANNFGLSADSGAAMFSTLTGVGNDQEGARTATAMIQLTRQLRDALPENDVYSFDGNGRRKLTTKGTGLTTAEDRLQALWDDPAKRERFLAGLHTEEKSRAGIEQLLTPGSAVQQEYLRNKQSIAGIIPQAGGFGASLDQASGLQTQAKDARDLAAINERRLLAALKAGETATIFKEADKAMENAGMSSTYRLLSRGERRMDTLMGQNPASAARMQLEASIFGGAESDKMRESPQFVAQQREKFGGIAEVIDVLKRIEKKQTAVGNANQPEGR